MSNILSLLRFSVLTNQTYVSSILTGTAPSTNLQTNLILPFKTTYELYQTNALSTFLQLQKKKRRFYLSILRISGTLLNICM